MDVSAPLAFLTDICSIYGINIPQVKVSLTSVTYESSCAKRYKNLQISKGM